MAKEKEVKIEKPYIIEIITTTIRKYNSRFGDNKSCECGHPYYRHFVLGKAADCKFCGCKEFKEKIIEKTNVV